LQDSWETVTLAEKIHLQTIKQSPRLVPFLIGKEATGLHVEWEVKPHEDWLTVRARGEDSEAFLNILKEKFGEAPVAQSSVERWDVRKGFITGSGKVGFGVYVDLGILQPRRKDALYPLHRMRAQLADGLARSSRDILAENALSDNFPVAVVVTDVEAGKVSVELTDETRDLLLSWRSRPFDRVIATGIDRDRIEKAVYSTRLEFDVIEVQSLSLLVQCLVCKVGTDAPGIISKIGGRLRGVGLTAFESPSRIKL